MGLVILTGVVTILAVVGGVIRAGLMHRDRYSVPMTPERKRLIIKHQREEEGKGCL